MQVIDQKMQVIEQKNASYRPNANVKGDFYFYSPLIESHHSKKYNSSSKKCKLSSK